MNASNTSSEALFPSSYPEYVYNFAYGSNMHPDTLTRRRKIQPIESIPGILEGWQLTFDLRGIPGVEPCFGNIKENPDSEIHGILHKMTSKDFRHLMTTEGGGGVDANGYIPTKLNVHAYDGRIIEAYALVVRQTSPAILCHHALPSNRYIGLLRNGAAHHNIHPLYIEYLQSLPSIERNKFIMVLVTIEILSVVTLLSPIWIPTVIYYACLHRKAQIRTFLFNMIVTNLWRIYRLCGAWKDIRPYYSAPFPRGSTYFKANTDGFRTEVTIDEHTLSDTASDISSESNSFELLPNVIKQRKNNQSMIEVAQQEYPE
ncbi:unnamed protein product [Rotaria socialis]|uniref:gamma-glutamylcyclotransferase n=1 Tax=Rotaria socialis TaxID=392032 RepID=A0A820MZ84_9BILA|nr:unnamed protein product [Rotaria socialis]CAF3545136.1 unnamed protein product [Rotaria socialis]CAF3722019.1 unnamed protein product [Rotaria socialis]CAF4380220.1 unnamed protein product [Rotaria socialis]CAF4503031.1 unnamed protein product [Rotaria socialis]